MFVCAAMTMATSVPCCYCSLFMCVMHFATRSEVETELERSFVGTLLRDVFFHSFTKVDNSLSLSLPSPSRTLHVVTFHLFFDSLARSFLGFFSFFLAFGGTRIECDEHVVLW